MLSLSLAQIRDVDVRRNFEKIQGFFRALQFVQAQMRFVRIQFVAAGTNIRYPHNLGFLPKDVLQTSLVGTGSLTWNYDKFDKEFLDITVTGPCTVRAFIGAYQDGSDLT